MTETVIQTPLATDETVQTLVEHYSDAGMQSVDHLALTATGIEYVAGVDSADLVTRVCEGWGVKNPAPSVLSPMTKLFTATRADYWAPLMDNDGESDPSVEDVIKTSNRIGRDIFGTVNEWSLVKRLCQAAKVVQRANDGDIDLGVIEFLHDCVDAKRAEASEGLRYAKQSVGALGAIQRAGYGEQLTDADRTLITNGRTTKAERDAQKQAQAAIDPDHTVWAAFDTAEGAMDGTLSVERPQHLEQLVRRLYESAGAYIAAIDSPVEESEEVSDTVSTTVE